MGLVVRRWFHWGETETVGWGDNTKCGDVVGGTGKGDWLGPPWEYVGGGGWGESLAAWYEAGGGVWLGNTCWDNGEKGDWGFTLWPGDSCEGEGDVWFVGLGTGFDGVILNLAEPGTSAISEDRWKHTLIL